jgi:hypothetical protein
MTKTRSPVSARNRTTAVQLVAGHFADSCSIIFILLSYSKVLVEFFIGEFSLKRCEFSFCLQRLNVVHNFISKITNTRIE